MGAYAAVKCATGPGAGGAALKLQLPGGVAKGTAIEKALGPTQPPPGLAG